VKRHLPGEERREFQKWSTGHKLGFVYGPDADYALELALRIIDGDQTAWEDLEQRHDLLTNVAADLRSVGERALADQVENMKLGLNEHRYVDTQEKTMRIRGSELRKIIKEELKRSMMKEVVGKIFKASVLVTDDDILDRTGKTYEGDLKFVSSTPQSFVADDGTTFDLRAQTKFADVDSADKTVPAKLTFISKNEAEVSY
jgi:hypothetical protein